MKLISARLRFRSSGQGVIGLSALIGLIMIPLIGIFAFEVARYQYGVQQLQANADSAALAGAAMLVTSRYQKPSQRLQRFRDAETAAENAFKSTFANTSGQLNVILGNTLTSSVNVGVNGTLTMGGQAGNCTFKVEAINPANLQVVQPTDNNAKAIRFSALFTGRPTFGRFLGLNSLVPIYSRSTAGVPILDVVVCFDVSGSMDDSTRVSFVNRRFTIPEPQKTNIGNLYNTYIQAKTALDNYKAGNSSPGYDQLYCNNTLYANALIAWDNYIRYRSEQALAVGKLEYAQVMCGTLGDCLFQPLNPNGSSANVLFPQSLNIINVHKLQSPPGNPQLPYFNCRERYFQETGDASALQPGPGGTSVAPCAPQGVAGAPSNFLCACPPHAGGITDLVAHIDSQVNNPNLQQPLFGGLGAMPLGPGARFTYVKRRQPYKGNAYVFDGIGYVVEAARGNLEPQRFNQLKDSVFKNNIAQAELPAQGQAGYQAAYQEMASLFCQPIGSTVDALENFYQALQGAGSDVNFGLVAYETRSGPPGRTEVPMSDIADRDSNVPNCEFDVNCSSPGPAGPRQRPVLQMALAPLKDAATDLIPDPTDATKPNLTVNECFETYLLPLRATNIAASLKEALSILQNSPRRAFARQVIVLITDGIATRDINGNISQTQGYIDSRAQAGIANQAGIPVFTIGVAQNPAVLALQVPFLGDESTPAPQGLATISGNGARYFSVNEASLTAATGGQVNAISQAFLQVARSLVQLIE